MKVKNILKSFFSMFLILTILITSGLPVSASVKFPTGRETEWSENNILFYNPSGDDCVTINHPGEAPSGDQITWIGDSYSTGAEDSGLLSLTFSGVDYGPTMNDSTSYIQSGKALGRDTGNNPSGIDVLKSIPKENLRKYVVFALGTNDYSLEGGGSGIAEEAVNYIGSDKILVLVTPADRQGGGGGSLRKFDDVIEEYKAVASRHSNVIIADWASVASESDFQNDNIHLKDYTKWVNTIKSAMAAGGTSEVICPDDNPCFDFDGGGDNANDHWDGKCGGVDSYTTWLNTHNKAIRDVASANGLPWEAIMAQTINESHGGEKEPCPFNPLGMRGGGYTKCTASDGTDYAVFHNYQEAFQAYVDNHIPTREARYKYPNDPYLYIEFIQHGASAHYAESTIYVQAISELICGVQKWAEANGIPTSAKTYRDYPNGIQPSEGQDGTITIPGVNPCGLDEGGLSEAQARNFVINYGANKAGLPATSIGPTLWSYCQPGGNGSNCVSFAAFFLNAFTGTHYMGGDGFAVAGNIGGSTRNSPKVWSIISATYGSQGHVAVVLGIHNGTYIVGHASCTRGHEGKGGPGNGEDTGSGSAFIKIETNPNPSTWNRLHSGTVIIAYPSAVNTTGIMEFAQ